MTPRFREAAALILLLASFFFLEYASILGKSATFDEPQHLVSGVSKLISGDFRMGPGHPPLAQMWAGLLPVLAGLPLPSFTSDTWFAGETFRYAAEWLFESGNDHANILRLARVQMILLSIGLLGLIYLIVRRYYGVLPAFASASLAALSPTMLAHAGLVTTDMASAFFFTGSLFFYALLQAKFSVKRLLLTGLFLAGLFLSKFSAPLIIPVLVGITAFAFFIKVPSFPTHGEPIEASTLILRQGTVATPPEPNTRQSVSQVKRLGVSVAVLLFLGSMVYGGIWACFGFRYSAFSDYQQGRDFIANEGAPKTGRADGDWEYHLGLRENAASFPARMVWTAKDLKLLPEAYLYGFAVTLKVSEKRMSYFMGELRDDGWKSYFPLLFLIKTAIPVLFLSIAGMLLSAKEVMRHESRLYHGEPVEPFPQTSLRQAQGERKEGLSEPSCMLRQAQHDSASMNALTHDDEKRLVLFGFLLFWFLYFLAAVFSHVNLGHRHLLPLYPLLFVFAGAFFSFAFREKKLLAAIAVGGFLWMAGINANIHPHYLSYYNEIVRGPLQGHHYAVDSNLDWGQDLPLLREYCDEKGGIPIKLSYFGTALPEAYGIKATNLPGFGAKMPVNAVLDAGDYVVSQSILFGPFSPYPAVSSKELVTALLKLPPGYFRSIKRFEENPEVYQAKFELLLRYLRQKAPDDRIGYSLALFHVTEEDLAKAFGFLQ